MTLAEQIKAAVTAAISDLRAALVKTPATAESSSPAPASPAAGMTDQVRAEITAAVNAAVAPIQSELASAKTTIATLQSEATAKDAKITELEKTIADPKGKIEAVASTKAAEIAAAQGVPALSVKPTENPATTTASPTALKGRARLEAGIAAELNKNFPATRTGN